MASLVSLPPLLKRVRQLEQAVAALTGQSPGADVPGAQERKAG
jgi:hypothetical protein